MDTELGRRRAMTVPPYLLAHTFVVEWYLRALFRVPLTQTSELYRTRRNSMRARAAAKYFANATATATATCGSNLIAFRACGRPTARGMSTATRKLRDFASLRTCSYLLMAGLVWESGLLSPNLHTGVL